MTVDGMARPLHTALTRDRCDQPCYDDLPDHRRERLRSAAAELRKVLTGIGAPPPRKAMNDKTRERRASK